MFALRSAVVETCPRGPIDGSRASRRSTCGTLALALLSAVTFVLGASEAASAQPARFSDAKVTTRTLAGSLDGEIRAVAASASSPVWIAWSVPANEAGRDNCCMNDRDGTGWSCGCQLESESHSVSERARTGAGKAVQLESSDRLVVLMRAEAGVVQRVTAFSADCELDAGGRPVAWLEGVTPAESVAVLSRYAKEPAHASRIGAAAAPSGPSPGTPIRRRGRYLTRWSSRASPRRSVSARSSGWAAPAGNTASRR